MSDTDRPYGSGDFHERRPRQVSGGVVFDHYPLPVTEALTIEIVRLLNREKRLRFLIDLANGLTVLGRFVTYPDPDMTDSMARQRMLQINEIIHTVVGQIDDAAFNDPPEWSSEDLVRSVYDKARAGKMEEWVAAGAVSHALWRAAENANLVRSD